MPLPRVHEGWYVISFFALFGLGFVAVTWVAIVGEPSGVLATVEAIAVRMGSVAVLSAIVPYVGLESINMLAERYARRQRMEGKAEGQAETLEVLERLAREQRDQAVQDIIAETREIIRRGQEREGQVRT